MHRKRLFHPFVIQRTDFQAEPLGVTEVCEVWDVFEQITGLETGSKLGFAAAVLIIVLAIEIYVVMRFFERFLVLEKRKSNRPGSTVWSEILMKMIKSVTRKGKMTASKCGGILIG